MLFVLEVYDSRRLWLLGLLVLLAGPFLRLQRSILLHELTSDRGPGFAKDVLAAKQVAAERNDVVRYQASLERNAIIHHLLNNSPHLLFGSGLRVAVPEETHFLDV